MASIRIFAPGTHRSAAGESLAFSAEDVAAIADGYDPKLHQAPLVRGHPAHDAPALGWVERLAVAEDGQLSAEFGDVAPEIKADLGAGRFRFVSSAFYRPGDAANPTPGKWYLRHVGVLGAMPPSVKGLGRAAFADDGSAAVSVEFGERPRLLADALTRIGWAFTAIAAGMRGQRERVIEAQGVEEADKTAPSYQIEQLTEAAVELRSLARDAGDARPALFADPDTTTTDTTTEEDTVTEAELQAENARLKAENERLAKADAKRAADTAHAANVAFCEGLVKDARLPQGQAATVVALLDHLGPVKPEAAVTFADAGGQAIQPDAALKALLGGLAPKVAFGELAGGGADAPAVAFSVPAGDGYQVDGASLLLHQRAVAYAAEKKVPYAEAVKAVGGR